MEETNKEEYVHTVDSLEINILYMLTQVFELIMRDFERRLRPAGIVFRHEKKQQFNRLMKSIKDIYTQFEILYQDLIISAEPHGWKELDYWQSDANDLARMVLLWADKCGPYPDHMEQVFRLMKTYKGEGIITDEVLEHFHMK